MACTFPEITISTERLLLRPFEAGDVPSLVEMMNDELVHAWTSVPHPYAEAHARAWALETAPAERAEGRGTAFAVAEQLTQRLVGTVQLARVDWRLRSGEFRFVTAPWARGEGYAPEALLAVAQWLFEEQGFQRLELRTAAGNAASQQVAQKIGCISEGVLRSAWIVRGTEPEAGRDGAASRTDLIVWGLLPEDFQALREDAAAGLAVEHSANWA